MEGFKERPIHAISVIDPETGVETLVSMVTVVETEDTNLLAGQHEAGGPDADFSIHEPDTETF